MEPREPIEHELKVWRRFFDALQSGAKTFELRRFDRDFRDGDTLRLRECADDEPSPSDEASYTGREIRRRITYVLGSHLDREPRPFESKIAPGWCILGIAPIWEGRLRAEGRSIYIEHTDRPGGFRFIVAATDSAEGVAAVLNGLLAGRTLRQAIDELDPDRRPREISGRAADSAPSETQAPSEA